jgi:hypothetical protein
MKAASRTAINKFSSLDLSFYYLEIHHLDWLHWRVCDEVTREMVLFCFIIALRPQTPKHIRGGWSHYTDTSEPVDGGVETIREIDSAEEEEKDYERSLKNMSPKRSRHHRSRRHLRIMYLVYNSVCCFYTRWVILPSLALTSQHWVRRRPWPWPYHRSGQGRSTFTCGYIELMLF